MDRKGGGGGEVGKKEHATVHTNIDGGLFLLLIA